MSFLISTQTYLSADENWLAEFYKRTGLSTGEIRALIKTMPSVLRSEEPCRNRQASLAVKAYSDLNVAYLHKMFGSAGVSGNLLMSLWSLKVFRDRSYSRFMGLVVHALNGSFSSGKPISALNGKVAGNLVLHNEGQLRFPVEAVKGIYDSPSAKDITRAFDRVKNAIRLGVDVDAVSKQLVVQAVKFDIASLDYMFKIEGIGPALERLGARIFRLYQETLEIVSAL